MKQNTPTICGGGEYFNEAISAAYLGEDVKLTNRFSLETMVENLKNSYFVTKNKYKSIDSYTIYKGKVKFPDINLKLDTTIGPRSLQQLYDVHISLDNQNDVLSKTGKLTPDLCSFFNVKLKYDGGYTKNIRLTKLYVISNLDLISYSKYLCNIHFSTSKIIPINDFTSNVSEWFSGKVLRLDSLVLKELEEKL